MKTLLLTLVVVTIVCLDLGDSLICYLDFSVPHTCAPGEKLCYTRTWNDGRGTRIERGCAATCPIPKKPEIHVTCCSTDRCNPHPKQKPH
uniref:Long neurotoxin 1 n=1 Tax=Pseudonaja textilis TaxID=8673 RepID=3L21_PSETE|nr:RecName: Full=Long neurotoxin 1; Short=LNTX-1; Flags: Precursor [Pseudonaja textilis]ABK63540.1 LNTX-1 precursor [Pseudonaja textilis]